MGSSATSSGRAQPSRRPPSRSTIDPRPPRRHTGGHRPAGGVDPGVGNPAGVVRGRDAAPHRFVRGAAGRPRSRHPLDRPGGGVRGSRCSCSRGRLEESLERADAALEVERIIEPTRYTLDAIAVRALAQAWKGEEVLAQQTIAAGRRVRTRFDSSFGDLYGMAEAWLTASRPPDASWIRAAATGGVAPIQVLASLAMARNCVDRDQAAGAASWLAAAEQTLAAVPEPGVLDVLISAIRAEVEDPGREVGAVPLSQREWKSWRRSPGARAEPRRGGSCTSPSTRSRPICEPPTASSAPQAERKPWPKRIAGDPAGGRRARRRQEISRTALELDTRTRSHVDHRLWATVGNAMPEPRT